MSAWQRLSRGLPSFRNGVHPPEHKELTSAIASRRLPFSDEIILPLSQHIGRPAEALVKPGDRVERGDVIAESSGFVSSRVHASAAGIVKSIEHWPHPAGAMQPSVRIEVDPHSTQLQRPRLVPHWDEVPAEQLSEEISKAGIVGLGGAAFPSHVKLRPPEDQPVDVLMVNGCECEPYLSADNRLMIEAASPVINGALLAARAAGAERIVVSIEDNKPEALAAMREAAAGSGVEVSSIATKYPQGAEKQLVLVTLGRTVPRGGLPLDVGVVVVNVGTAAAIARAVQRGKPLTHRIVTVSGDGIATPKNVLVPIGTAYRDVIEFAGGLRSDAARVIAGGPMMGFTLGEFGVPVTKGTSGITVLTHDNLRQAEETACVRCGRCVDVCPMKLVPTRIALAARYGSWDLVGRFHADACMECGCCAFECPAQIPLVQLIRLGKVHLAA